MSECLCVCVCVCMSGSALQEGHRADIRRVEDWEVVVVVVVLVVVVVVEVEVVAVAAPPRCRRGGRPIARRAASGGPSIWSTRACHWP